MTEQTTEETMGSAVGSLVPRLQYRARWLYDAVEVRLPAQKRERRTADADRYWNDLDIPNWKNSSHWRDRLDDRDWDAVSADHLATVDLFAMALDVPPNLTRWSSGAVAEARTR